ncbi:MAG: 16S rRNA (uracil(1498)-N(3))-methyltransferase [Nitrospirota bacterium]
MRIILSKEDIKGKKVPITGEKARYLISVLRCKKGDSLQVLDGEGNSYSSKIIKIENKEVIIEISEKLQYNTESPLNLILVQGILKGEKMDWVIQKITELGVKEIIPAITERSQVRHTRKIERWRKIAEEASRQSGRTIIPTVHEPVEFKDFFSKQACINYPPQSPLTKGGIKGGGFIFYEDGGMSLKEAIHKIRIYDTGYTIQDKENRAFCIGHHASSSGNYFESQPQNFELMVAVGTEGGFTREEINFAEEKGLFVISLGKRILRAETAAITAVALIQFLIGDL